MYGHGFGTLFLAECYGMSKRSDHRDKLAKAIRLVIRSQNTEGGWRYLPQRKDSDLSVTVCQMMALRASRDAGLFVAKEVMDRATQYLRSCQASNGGFRYQSNSGEVTFARTAAALIGFYSAGIYDGAEVKKGLKYLSTFHPTNGKQVAQYFFYGHYYASLAMQQVGGERWNEWYNAIRSQLIERQNQKDGSWQSAVWSPEYATALATTILQIPNDLVPIFQR